MDNNSKIISLKDLNSSSPSYLETIFSLANGHFGVRASNPVSNSLTAGTIVNGFYETSEIVYGEKAYGYAKNNQTIVKLPDLRAIKIFDANKKEFNNSDLEEEYLDMNSGILTSIYKLTNSADEAIELTLKSFLQQSNNQILGLHYEIKSLGYLGEIKIEKHLNVVDKIDDTDDPRKSRQIHTLSYDKEDIDKDHEILTVRTKVSQMSLQMAIYTKDTLEENTFLDKKGIIFDAVGIVGDINASLNFSKIPTIEEIVSGSTNFWKEFWNNSEVNISGDDSLNLALHYNLFQLTSSTGRDGKTNIPAKGLSGTGYEGHYFWDTEMYMSPFFAYTNPDIARNLIKYRYSILDESKQRARELGVDSGVLFAWRTINGQEASAYYPAGTAQYHINADIAYAINRYYQVTDDKLLMRKYGFEIVLETARFWKEFGSFSEINGEKKFCFFDVTGPDEYTAIVNNNYYTNRMAKFNLFFAVELIDEFSKKAHELGVTQKERDDLFQVAQAIYLPYDSDKEINEQDDSAFNKPIWPFEDTPKENYPLLLHYHPLTIYRYQVNKQADTLLADFLFDDISQEQLVREYNYYEKITTHDSSLSRSIFSALAARIGLQKKAYSYFMDTVKTDLIDLQHNTADGLHVANLGGSWVTVVNGFGGLQVKNNHLLIDNHLPKEWNKLSIRIKFRGRLLEINYLSDSTEVKLLSGDTIKVIVDGKEMECK